MSESKQLLPTSVLFFFTLACIGISVWFLSTYAALFNSLFLAAMIAMTASPLGFWLQGHGTPRWIALLLSIVVALSATILIVGVLTVSAIRLIDTIPLLVENTIEAQSEAGPLLSRLGLTTSDLQEVIPPEALTQVAISTIHLLVESVSMLGLVILIVIFMIFEAFLLPTKIENREELDTLSSGVAIGYVQGVRQYVGITSLLGILGGVVVAIILYVLDVPFSGHWGILYFVLSFVPMIGFWIAVIPPMLVAAQSAGATTALVVLVAYLIVATVINQGIKPAVIRSGLDISPFWSIMSLIVWSAILGPIGFVVGVPLTVALKALVLTPDSGAHWVADLLSAGLPVQKT